MITVTCAEHLITTKDDYKKGFSDIVVEKNIRIKPYISKCRSVQIELGKAKVVPDLVKIPELHAPLITSAGLSQKALKNIGMTYEEEKDIISDFIIEAINPAGLDFKNEISLRYTLITGDSFGGHMRNVIGSTAKLKLAEAIMGCLLANEIEFRVLLKGQKRFIDYDIDSLRLNEMSALSWQNNQGQSRVLLFDKKCPIISKNVDVILLDATEKNYLENLSTPSCYISCGELKGGIDPAGADEHWKTGNSAIARLRLHKDIKLFFIASAIEASMANEIFNDIQASLLHMAANLNKVEQITEVGNWLANV